MIKIEGVDPKMIANNLTPSEPIHPGEILKDEIEYRCADGNFSHVTQ